MQNDHFEYLRPPQAVFNIKHEANYVFHRDGQSTKRNVFSKVPYTEAEQKAILEVEEALRTQSVKLPEAWSSSDTLKYCYTGDFKLEKIVQKIKLHLAWLTDSVWHLLTPQSEKFLRDGVVYQFGRDAHFRPNVYIKIAQVPTDYAQLQPFLTALCCILNIVVKYMLVPYHVERMNIVLDASQLSILRVPFKVISRIIEITELNYNNTLESLYILEPPMIFVAASKIIKNFIHPDTQAKIRILPRSQFAVLHSQIPVEVIQKKHGGLHQNLEQYWPIRSVDHFEQTVYYSVHFQDEEISQTQATMVFDVPKSDPCSCAIM